EENRGDEQDEKATRREGNKRIHGRSPRETLSSIPQVPSLARLCGGKGSRVSGKRRTQTPSPQPTPPAKPGEREKDCHPLLFRRRGELHAHLANAAADAIEQSSVFVARQHFPDPFRDLPHLGFLHSARR